MSEEPGLRINGVFYPLPESFKLGEARTIRRMTNGMSMQEFAASLGRLDRDLNPDVFAAWVWVAMHRQDQSVTPEDVDALEFEQIEAQGGDAGPPETTSSGQPTTGSGESAEGSSGRSGSDSETNPNGSGVPGLASIST